jgi:hypothetical protein
MRAVVFAIVVGLVSVASANQLDITVTTTPNGGPYAPKHVVATWIEDASGNFIKTIDREASARVSHLVAWIAKSGQDADAVTGATIANHTNPLHISWDLKNRAGVVVPDGTYTIRMELADSNSTQPAQNHQGTFTFVKGASSSMQTGLSNGGFVNATVAFTASACNNGVVEAGETCDGNCPASCPDSGDPCAPIVMTGAAATCDVSCDVQPVQGCGNNGSGSAGGTGDNQVIGGCASTSGSGALLVVLALGGLVRSGSRRSSSSR